MRVAEFGGQPAICGRRVTACSARLECHKRPMWEALKGDALLCCLAQFGMALGQLAVMRVKAGTFWMWWDQVDLLAGRNPAEHVDASYCHVCLWWPIGGAHSVQISCSKALWLELEHSFSREDVMWV